MLRCVWLLLADWQQPCPSAECVGVSPWALPWGLERSVHAKGAVLELKGFVLEDGSNSILATFLNVPWRLSQAYQLLAATYNSTANNNGNIKVCSSPRAVAGVALLLASGAGNPCDSPTPSCSRFAALSPLAPKPLLLAA